MRYVKFLALLLLFFFTMALFAQNMEALAEPLELRFGLFGTQWFYVSQPIYLCLLVVLVLGGFLTMLFFLAERMRLSRSLGRCRGRLASLEQEVNSLRNLPLEDQGRPFSAASSSASSPASSTLDDDEDDETGRGA